MSRTPESSIPSAPHPFSQFPNEIIRDIFELTARIHPSTGLTLSVLSRNLRPIILPILVETVILRSIRQTHAFILLILLRPELANCVHNLWVTYFDPADVCAPIFSLCTKVNRAALQHTFLRYRLDPTHSLNDFTCQELAIVGPSFANDWESAMPDSKLFGSISRLRLFDTLSLPKISGARLASLPNLTHLALPFHEHIDETNPFLHLESILKSPSLLYIVIVINHSMITPLSARTSIDAWAISARKWDDRLYVVFSDTRDPDSLEWERASRTDEDIWERAAQERQDRDARLILE